MRRAEELSCVTPLRANPVRRPDDTSERRAVPCGLGHVRENFTDTDLRANHSGVCRAGRPRQIGTGAAVAGHRNPVWPHIGVCRADQQRGDDADPIRVGAPAPPGRRRGIGDGEPSPGHGCPYSSGSSAVDSARRIVPRCRYRCPLPPAPGHSPDGTGPREWTCPALSCRAPFCGSGGPGLPRRGEMNVRGETVRTICCPARSATGRARAVDLVQRLVRTYVILILPKCLLTWGYVKVDPAAFLSTARGTGTAHPPGRWRFDL